MTVSTNPVGTAMKIARAEAIHLAIPSRYGGPQPRGTVQWPLVHMVLVRVETDAGLVGWGEAFGHAASATTRAAFDTLVAPLAVGADAGDIAGLGGRLRRSLYTYGTGGPVAFALSGLDIALSDIRGKAAGVPVHRLLGAASAPASVAAYASLLRYGDADSVGEAAADAVARGHRAVKLHEASADTVAAARAAVGPEVELSLDVNCRWPEAEALALARTLEPYDLAWIEEPAWPVDYSLMKTIAAETGIPVAAGENAATLTELARLADRGGVAVLQPSVTKLGGLSAMVEAREVARTFAARLAPHSAYFGPGLAATIHFCAGSGPLDCEWYDCRLEVDPCGLRPVAGRLAVPADPGLGIDIDAGVIARYRVT